MNEYRSRFINLNNYPPIKLAEEELKFKLGMQRCFGMRTKSYSGDLGVIYFAPVEGNIHGFARQSVDIFYFRDQDTVHVVKHPTATSSREVIHLKGLTDIKRSSRYVIFYGQDGEKKQTLAVSYQGDVIFHSDREVQPENLYLNQVHTSFHNTLQKSREQVQSDSFHVVYLSGMPKTGKTTQKNIFANRLRSQGNEVLVLDEFDIPNPPPFVLQTNYLSSQDKQLKAQLWVVDQHIEKNRKIFEAYEKRDGTKPFWVLCDRTWMDALFYSLAYNQDVQKKVLSKIESINWFPGIHVILLAQPPYIQERRRKVHGIVRNNDEEKRLENLIRIRRGMLLFDDIKYPGLHFKDIEDMPQEKVTMKIEDLCEIFFRKSIFVH